MTIYATVKGMAATRLVTAAGYRRPLTEGIVTPGNGVTTVIRFPRECDHPQGEESLRQGTV